MMPNAELTALEMAVRTYLDGLYEGDVAKLESVFHPTSALTQFMDGELRITPRAAWMEAVRNRPAPKAGNLAREDHILAIDLIAPGMALVKVQCQIPPRYFTDLLSFLKVDGRWQVVQKVYQTEVWE